jgi:hypothetical protein
VRTRDVVTIGAGAVLAAAIAWALLHPSSGGSFPFVFRGKTQAASVDGDGVHGVALYPHKQFTETFDAFPSFFVTGENRTKAIRADMCLAPGTGEQDVIFAVARKGRVYSMVWYACLTEGIDLDW